MKGEKRMSTLENDKFVEKALESFEEFTLQNAEKLQSYFSDELEFGVSCFDEILREYFDSIIEHLEETPCIDDWMDHIEEETDSRRDEILEHL